MGVRASVHLLGLEDVISMDVADGQSDFGWVFRNGSVANPWNQRDDMMFLHEV
jgi:hypothetical protein